MTDTPSLKATLKMWTSADGRSRIYVNAGRQNLGYLERTIEMASRGRVTTGIALPKAILGR